MKKIYIWLFLIVILAAVLRIYRIDNIPPSLSWDEAAVGYNAYSVANYGRDEYGKLFPLVFRSFGEDKQPIHIYFTAIFVKFFGLSEFSTRSPAAIMGSLNVLLIFFLAKKLFKDERIGLFSSLFLAISPQNLFFSRFNHEANFALFFFFLGLLLFFMAIGKRKYFLTFSLLSFFLSVISYHAAEIAVPLIVILLLTLYFKKIFSKATILIGFFLLTAFIPLVILNPRLFGIVRYNQTKQDKNDVEKTFIFQKTHNYLLGRINLVSEQYFSHFDPKFLFGSEDKNFKLSVPGQGEFYKIDIVFLFLGLVYLLRKRSREGLLVLSWALIGPLPSSLFAEAPHAGRAAFMMGSWHLISALGFYWILTLLKPALKKVFVIITLIALMLFLSSYLSSYFGKYAKMNAIDWQYGMKQIVEYVKDHEEYSQVYTTAVRSQPYIFFLYYLKMPLASYLNTVIYNNSEDKSYNSVASFDRYFFKGWSPFESEAQRGVLYVLGPSEYDGLRYRSAFDVKKIIYYPNGTNAFFLVSLK